MNYHSIDDLQEYFDSASAIVNEAFPKQQFGDYLSEEAKGACQSYIPHGAHLSLQFSNYLEKDASTTKIKGFVSPHYYLLP